MEPAGNTKMQYRYSESLILAPLAPSPQVRPVAGALITDGVDVIGGRGLRRLSV